MTRFARAKGSKASNERAPEDSTPWEVMKEQLLQAKKDNEDSKNRKEAENKRIENYENFLKEQKVQKRKATWCDFPEAEQKERKNSITQPTEKAEKRNKKKKKNNKPLDVENNVSNEDENQEKPKKNKGKPQTTTEPQNISEVTVEIVNGNKKKKKKNKKAKKSQSTEGEPNHKSEDKQNTINSNQANQEKNNKQSNEKPKKKKKLVDGKPVRRKEVNDRSFQLIINGKEIELVRFDGFPVMRKDAERLEELKSSMLKKGIPKSEVQRTIKLERRRAEKALARVKRDVCYNCRKGGHVLSDCPELKSKIPGADGADGVCFKCGSTEHRQFECKVQKDKEFRFATCFICKEPGHIARQCPDNPKGLYPNGGSCKLCGDVTHLRKDCPTVSDKREGSNIKLQTLDSGENIEDVGSQSNAITPQETSKKPKKIKF